jgi:drug/metabolite transporter (DMT)-like permease
VTSSDDRPLTGALFVVFASACFAGAGMFVQLASRHAGEFVVTFSGFAVGGAITIPLALLRGPGFLASAHRRLLIIRSLVGVTQIMALFVAFMSITLVEGMLLRDAAPLWVPVLSALIWKERMPGRLWFGLVLGFIGMALVLHPGFAGLDAGYLFALAAGILFGFQSILSRRIDQHGEPVLRTLFYIYVVGVAVLSVPAFLEWRAMPVETWFHLAGAGILLLMSTTGLLIGFRYAPAYVLAPLGYSAVVFSALLDWWVFDEPPGILTIAGAVLVTVASLLIIRLSRSARAEPATAQGPQARRPQ